MADISTALPPSTSHSPYRLDVDQTLKASTALLQHVKKETERLKELSSKKSLFVGIDESSESDQSFQDDQPIWLTLTTKQHIVDKNRLKPSKITVPHALNKSSSLSICIISADPQVSLENVIADPSFPPSLSSRISRVIGYSKLRTRYKDFESRRGLVAEHDIFLADDRIITRLPSTLGKIFYKGTTKRPIPIHICHEERLNGRRIKQDKRKVSKNERQAAIGSPAVVAKEIQSTINTVPVSLKPGTSVAVRVGNATFTPQHLAENVEAVATGIIGKHVVKGWRNVKSIHIKSPTSAALPLWLADDMWVADDDVINTTAAEEPKLIEGTTETARKRKGATEDRSRGGIEKKIKVLADTSLNEDNRALAAARKAKLKQQKSKALLDGTVLP